MYIGRGKKKTLSKCSKIQNEKKKRTWLYRVKITYKLATAHEIWQDLLKKQFLSKRLFYSVMARGNAELLNDCVRPKMHLKQMIVTTTRCTQRNFK